MKTSKRKKLLAVVTILIILVVALVVSIVLQSKRTDNEAQTIKYITETELNNLPVLDLGDGEATQEDVKPADITGEGVN